VLEDHGTRRRESEYNGPLAESEHDIKRSRTPSVIVGGWMNDDKIEMGGIWNFDEWEKIEKLVDVRELERDIFGE
jgi:hypothetical protein